MSNDGEAAPDIKYNELGQAALEKLGIDVYKACPMCGTRRMRSYLMTTDVDHSPESNEPPNRQRVFNVLCSGCGYIVSFDFMLLLKNAQAKLDAEKDTQQELTD